MSGYDHERERLDYEAARECAEDLRAILGAALDGTLHRPLATLSAHVQAERIDDDQTPTCAACGKPCDTDECGECRARYENMMAADLRNRESIVVDFHGMSVRIGRNSQGDHWARPAHWPVNDERTGVGDGVDDAVRDMMTILGYELVTAFETALAKRRAGA